MADIPAQESFASTSRYAYEVFLSFRGKDTRKTFTGHLYTALVQAGLHTFRDENEIERGKKIKLELEKGIQQSRASILVFSKDYASSRWCLDELVMILECTTISKHVIVPLFYDVNPTDVRDQLGSIGEAFSIYEEQLKMESDGDTKKDLMDKVNGWKLALREVADLAGLDLKYEASGDESKFIRKVVTMVQNKLSHEVLEVAPYMVGIHSRASDVNLWLQHESSSVRIMMICGMAGLGKSTIAKFVFNQNSKKIAGCSFLANIRELSEQPKGLIDLQRQLLSDICKCKKVKINNIHEGIIKIKKALNRKRVLIVLDDVDDFSQLYAILGMRDWFFSGTKIIITTRSGSLLRANEVDNVYKVEPLNHDESIKLFCLHAFKQDHPHERYIENTNKVVHYCDGLPLALQLLGCSLSSQKLDVWESALKKLEMIPNAQILKKLKLSLESLDVHDKKLFLHIACFLLGRTRLGH